MIEERAVDLLTKKYRAKATNFADEEEVGLGLSWWQM